MKIRLPIILIIIQLIMGCATGMNSGGAPAWVQGKDEHYPLEEYIIGLGQAPAPELAGDRARAELSKTFEANVRALTRDMQRHSGKMDSQGESSESKWSVSRDLLVSTSKVVQGVEIAQTWFDEKGGRYYALAVLSREKAGRILRDRIRELDGIITARLDEDIPGNRVFSRLVALRKALNAHYQRAERNLELRVVHPTGLGLRPLFQTSLLEQRFEARLRELHVHADVPADFPELGEVLVASLKAAGVSVPEGEGAQWVLGLGIEVEDLGKRDGWFWERWILVLSLEDQEGETVGQDRWFFKAAAITRDSVAGKLLDQIQSRLERDLRTLLIDFMEVRLQSPPMVK